MSETLPQPEDIYPAPQMTRADLEGNDWRRFSRCADSDPDKLFFGHRGIRIDDMVTCGYCPVRDFCLKEDVLAPSEYQRFGTTAALSSHDVEKVIKPILRVDPVSALKVALELQEYNMRRAYHFYRNRSLPQKQRRPFEGRKPEIKLKDIEKEAS